MNMTKSLVLGSAAALLAMGGAQAADLPLKAKAVEYVRICSLYGAGFYYIPGTDTCIKIGGVLRADVTFNGTVYDNPAMYGGNVAYHNRTSDYYSSRARMQLTVDTRTATEYGVVRTFGLSDWDFTEQNGLSGNGSPGSNFTPENLFLQFAGFTIGKSASAYSTPWHSYPGNNTINVLGGGDSVIGVNNVQYTAQFGAGITGTIGLDQSSSAFNRTAIANLQTAAATVGIGSVTNAYGGAVAPDIVGNIRVDQAWGLFQLSGALHDNNATYYSTPAAAAEINGHPGSKWGGAVMAALQIKNIPTGAGDDIKMDASYAVGATHYTTGIFNNTNLFQFSGTGVAGAYQGVGFASITDAVYATGTSLELTTSYGFRGGFNHNWNQNWSTSLFGGIGWYKYNTNAKAIYCTAFGNAVAGLNAAGGYTCNPDSTLSEIGLITRWTPVNNLTFSLEAVYWNLDQKFSGTATMTNAQLGNVKPTAVYSFKDQNGVVADIRIQRNF